MLKRWENANSLRINLKFKFGKNMAVKTSLKSKHQLSEEVKKLHQIVS